MDSRDMFPELKIERSKTMDLNKTKSVFDDPQFKIDEKQVYSNEAPIYSAPVYKKEEINPFITKRADERKAEMQKLLQGENKSKSVKELIAAYNSGTEIKQEAKEGNRLKNLFKNAKKKDKQQDQGNKKEKAIQALMANAMLQYGLQEDEDGADDADRIMDELDQELEHINAPKEIERQEQGQVQEEVRQEQPIQEAVQKKEELKKEELPRNVHRLKPGEALGRYVKEFTSKIEQEKNEGRKKLLEDALASVMSSVDILKNDDGTKESLRARSRSLDASIKKVDAYLKQSKRFGEKQAAPNEQEEDRSLREAAQMLKIQLFLEKTVLFERDQNEEVELYNKQLQADARIRIYEEFLNKNKQPEAKEGEKKEEQKEGNQPVQDMQSRKEKQLQLEAGRQTNIYSGKISENEQQAKLLQENVEKLKGYSLSHEEFNKNDVYKEQVTVMMQQMRSQVMYDWMSDNKEQITDNVRKLQEIWKKDTEKLNNTNGLKNVQRLLNTELTTNESIEEAGREYQKLFEEMARLSNEEIALIPIEIRDYIAAQAVLFEKRAQIKKELDEEAAA